MGHEAVESDVRSDVGNVGRTGLVMLILSFVDPDPERPSAVARVDLAHAIRHWAVLNS